MSTRRCREWFRFLTACFCGLGFAVAGVAAEPEAPRPLHRITPDTPQALRELFRSAPGVLPIVSAHRGGAAANYPENCLETFEHTLQHTWALLEVDPRLASDGVVLHHDPTLERTTTGTGVLTEHSLRQLRALQLKDRAGSVTEFRLPTLDEAIEWARGKTVLVLDQKDVPLETRIAAIEAHEAEAFVMLIVPNFRDVAACHDRNPNITMEVMIPDRERMHRFDELGVPWECVVPFVGHQPPEDRELYRELHARGVRCLIGTSRNLDRRLLSGEIDSLRPLQPQYRAFLDRGADLIETDLPIEVAQILYADQTVPEAAAQILRRD